MSEAKDPLLKKMMMNSKQFIGNPAFNDELMNKIRKQDKRRSYLKTAVFYSIPVLCTGLLLILFSGKINQNVNSITIQLTADNVLQFFKVLTDKLHLLFVLVVLVIAQRLMRLKASVVK